jgi:DNA modification methylase
MKDPEKTLPLVDTRVIDCGDNLEQLKKLPDKCIDLVYIDPPSDSNGTFKEFWKELKEKVAFKDCPESTQAYLNFMRPRCVELARVLKPTGSFYFHCDWDAKHQIEMMLNEILGQSNFINEFRWKRPSNDDDAAHTSDRLGHSTVLLYVGDSKCYFEYLYRPDDEDFADKLYTKVEPETGRRYRFGDLVTPRGDAPLNEKAQYEFLGVTGYWRFSKEDMQKLYGEGRIDQARPGAEPHFKRYLDEVAGVPVGSAWDDIQPLQSHGEERLEYPAQEPLKLLEKILEISSQTNNAALDAGRRGGTALVAALDSGQQLIGIGHFSNVVPLPGELASEDAGTNGQTSAQVLPNIA